MASDGEAPAAVRGAARAGGSRQRSSSLGGRRRLRAARPDCVRPGERPPIAAEDDRGDPAARATRQIQPIAETPKRRSSTSQAPRIASTSAATPTPTTAASATGRAGGDLARPLARDRERAAGSPATTRAARRGRTGASEVEQSSQLDRECTAGSTPTIGRMDAPRASPAAADRDDRGGQLDARPRGGARAGRRRRSPRRSRPTPASSTSTTTAPTSSSCARPTARASRR